MEDRQLAIDADLKDLDLNDWFSAIDDIYEEFGFFEQLGQNHCAGFLEAGNNLLVTFENAATVQAQNSGAEPRGFAYARHDGWSHLGIFSFHESWFRDPAIYAFFDRLSDDGFFDDFAKVVFYGGDGGTAYAAAAYSIAAPGATVIALRPQATLAAETAGWDERYKTARRYDFNDRYGYAPEMIDGAGKVFVAYDPLKRLDACHAALFRKAHVTALPCPLLGSNLERAFDRMGIHDVMIKLAMDGALDRKRFMQLLRARRYDQTYARTLARHLVMTGHRSLARIICVYMLQRGQNPYFSSQLAELSQDDDS